jgi:predicted phage gp36 major capsid-like protein
MPDVYGFPLSPADMIRVETRHEAIDRMAEEAKAELREMIAKARAEPRVHRRPLVGVRVQRSVRRHTIERN